MDSDETKFHICRLILMYMSRPHCKGRNKVLQSLIENVDYLPEEIRLIVVARAIISCNSEYSLSWRQDQLNEALDILEEYEGFRIGETDLLILERCYR